MEFPVNVSPKRCVPTPILALVGTHTIFSANPIKSLPKLSLVPEPTPKAMPLELSPSLKKLPLNELFLKLTNISTEIMIIFYLTVVTAETG